MPGRCHVTLTGKGPCFGFNAEVIHGASMTAYSVGESTVYSAIHVEVVGVVITNLGGFVRQRIKLRTMWVAELDILLEAQAQKARQVAIALCARQVVIGCCIGKHKITCRLQLITELMPELPLQQGLFIILIHAASLRTAESATTEELPHAVICQR